MKSFFLIILSLSFASISIVLHAQTSRPAIHVIQGDNSFDTFSNSISFLDNSFDARLGLPVSIGPDNPCLRMSTWNGKWKNMIGHSFGLSVVRYKNWYASVNTSAFIELHDVIPGQFMSWQLWRGNLGTSLFLENKKLNSLLFKGSRLVLQTGWYHESQHVTDGISYAAAFLNRTDYDNGSLRSFEYYTAQLHYVYSTPKNEWTFYLNAGYKYFPQPLLMTAKRNMQHAYLFEGGVHKKLDNYFELYVQGYFEHITNSFRDDSSPYSLFKASWDAKPFMTRQIEIGGQLAYRKKRVNLFWALSNSNGRGLDFIKVFKDAGAGVRFSL